MPIQKVHAREVLDSRGNPTVEVEVTTEAGMFRSAVPSGASTGVHEACELRDGDKARYIGTGCLQAVKNVNEVLAPALVGKDEADQAGLDKMMCELDGTKNKSKLGANAILGCSMAISKAAAAKAGVPLYKYIAQLAGTKEIRLPVPCFNVINGGKHAGNVLPFQEFMIAPTKAVSFHEALRMGSEVYHALKSIIKKKYGQDAVNVGDEGGFAPPIKHIDEPLPILMEAIEKAGHKGKFAICMDCAASEAYDASKKMYNLTFKNPEPTYVSAEKLQETYTRWVAEYPLVSIEDPFNEDNFDEFAAITKALEGKAQIVGDDLTVTNVERVKMAIDKKACNSLLLKINQIGTISESIAASKLCMAHGWSVMVSHRSGETEDTYIADLSVGLGTGQIKTGAPCRGERTAKLNQLLRIEEELGGSAKYGYPGWA
ncbi:Enolase [Leptomonas pyrrhocoris]|uniref:phosphopyruvate hydratase n=1 Tax=Leptomonas pyrrhocoris TaxID=157538 RepID=A0A0M9FWH9_LEPPY|nr:Enolase [Leptomonas pyrrhocoris]XP_015655762.1 Enolase [Leptomonas pyrrhocoris]XP_015655763.1 Enolase [Leptomonas pyrrhocoris]XP_015655764.1 Enolase [Leptomonas pyrrhocoris]XP_015655765.1 Enolase [Leptomonas pyrrhocoris]KPA77322.1 Enolase [Leptomonas pyrrhocoris]KPA77323.1 Enolase [Leptomonas pyrrhocoris]KPA77324.1 Enolase [Leptomonas pyrrhocoris]KPA77325.1 Enolase [Leptomonas pyrrhocoris]KPA77326.1 Enolase [Leptomonas pyrrhocoris]|eukprot:XP_015655761.1 Enolase [Leptomonas pyrrhocoris]